MNVAEYIVRNLKKLGIKEIFGYQGGNITYLVDAISCEKDIKYIQTYNEQGAAFAANSYAQITGNFGVSISSSGPGAINMINGIANAYYDSIPCLFITGNINTTMFKDSKNIRQNGFQELNIVNIVSDITKYAITVESANETKKVLEHALEKMFSGRPGPVLLDIPHNIQREKCCAEDILMPVDKNSYEEIDIDYVINQLNFAEKPVLLLGAGARSPEVTCMIEKIVNQKHIPIVSSLHGKDVVNNNEYYFGFIGTYAQPYSNKILNESDFVLVLGSRLDERQRVIPLSDFLNNALVVHVDVDKHELGHVCKAEIKIRNKVSKFLSGITEKLERVKAYDKWYEVCLEYKLDKNLNNNYIYGEKIDKSLKNIFGDKINDAIICVDVGKNQMAAAQSINLGNRISYLNSGGLGSMGYALPASIGASYADNTRKIYCVVGDGGLMMNLQELEVIKRDRLIIDIIVINNKGLGMIEDYQSAVFNNRLFGSKIGYQSADFNKIADAFDLDYIKYRDDLNIDRVCGKSRLIEIEV